jgi:type IV secretory pathway TrbL component
MLVLLLIVVLIILSLMFGGFQKGTKSGSLAPLCATCTSAPMASGHGG